MWFSLIVVSVLVLGCIYGRRIRKWNEFRKKINKLPNMQHRPIIGDMEFIMAKSSKELFSIKRKRKGNELNEPVYSWLFHIPFIFVNKPEDVEKIISNVDHIEKGLIYKTLLPWLKTGLLTSTGLKWHHRRKILTPAFHFNILQEFLGVFHSESKRLVESLTYYSNQEIDIKPFITKFTLFSICETAMGICLESFQGQTEYCNAIHKIGDISVERIQKIWLMIDLLFYLSKEYWIQKSVLKTLHKFSSAIISERKKYIRDLLSTNRLSYSGRKRVAMLDLLLTNQLQNGEIDDEGIREEVDTFMFEGHDTTAVSLMYTLMILANHRECQDKIYEEIMAVIGDSDEQPTYSDLQNLKYMEQCIKESLRLYPSVPTISRITGCDVKTESGLIIPAGCNVVIEIFDLHRRPEVFPDPEKFDPDRFSPENIRGRHPFAYIPFSGGPRNCIGQKFAMMELKCCLLNLLRNFILEPVDTPETIEFIVDMTLRCDGPLRVKFIQRK